MMRSMLAAYILGAFSELGDKTQWLALGLAARSRKTKTVVLGVLLGTAANHCLAAFFGGWLSAHVSPQVIGLAAAILFLLFGLWALRHEGEAVPSPSAEPQKLLGVAALFFLAEMGDKTQLATLALAARAPSPWVPAVGTTLGTATADLLAVGLGATFLSRLPARILRVTCAGLFFTFGMIALVSAL